MFASESRKNYIDYLKGLGILLVVLLHVTSNYWYSGCSANLYFYMLVFCLCSIAVPLFFTCTGAVMLDREEAIPTKKLYSRYILRILISLLIYSAIYEFWAYCKEGMFGSLKYGASLSKNLLYSDVNVVLWFLYAILGAYMMMPVLSVFTRHASRRELCYYLAVAFLCNVACSLSRISALSFLSTMFWGFSYVGIFMNYTGYFIMGYYLSHYEIAEGRKKILYVVCVGLLLATIIAQAKIIMVWHYSGTGFFDYLSPNTAILAAGLFLLMKNRKWKMDGAIFHFFQGAGRLSLGIYLIHMGFVAIFVEGDFGIANTYLKWCESLPTEGVILLNTVIIFLCSYAMSFLLRKIPRIGRYLA